MERTNRPYRFELLNASAQEVRLANEREDRSGSKRYEESEIALERIRRGAPEDRARVDVWVTHPDERVRSLLIELRYHWVDPDIKKRTSIEWSGAKAPLLGKIFDDAEAEGAWTPLVDQANTVDYVATQVPTRELLGTLAPWFKTASGADIDRFLDFESVWARSAALGQTTRLGPDRVERVARRFPSSSTLLLAMAQNPSLERTSADRLARTMGLLLVEYLDAGGGFPEPASMTIIMALVREGHEVPAAAWENVVAACERVGASPAWTHHWPRWLLDQIKENGPRLPPDVAYALVPYLDTEWSDLGPFVEKQAPVHPLLARRLLAHSKSSRLRAYLATTPAATDDEVRQSLLASRIPAVMAEIAKEGHPELTSPRLAQLLDRAPHLALDVIEKVEPAALRSLAPSRLTSLLSHEDRRIRSRAVTALARLPAQRTSRPMR